MTNEEYLQEGANVGEYFDKNNQNKPICVDCLSVEGNYRLSDHPEDWGDPDEDNLYYKNIFIRIPNPTKPCHVCCDMIDDRDYDNQAIEYESQRLQEAMDQGALE